MPSEARIPTLPECLDRVDLSDTQKTELSMLLLAREDLMAAGLHQAGMNFGLFPQIVAETLAEVGLGTPKSEAERAMIRTNFVNLMEAIQRAQSGEGPMPTP